MDLANIREQLLPRYERDPRFLEFLRRVSGQGLQTVAVVEIAAALLLQFGRMAVGGEAVNAPRLLQTAAVVAAGALTLALARLSWSRRHPRLLACFSVWLAPTLLLWAASRHPASPLGTDDYILTAITLIVLTAVASIPLLPWHTLALGLAIEGMYILSYWFPRGWEFSSGGLHGASHHIFLVLLALLATGISAANYGHTRAEFEATQEAVRVAEALTGAQLRAQLAENAISIGKMAAALSHEINSPLGVLRSSVETLLAVTDRQLEAPPETRARLADTRTELRRSIDESVSRIDDVTHRLRRFVNLEDSDLKTADLNELLSDVALLHQDDLQEGHVRVDLDLQKSLPPLTCRPQLLTAVFSSLLSNAIHAVNGDGRIAIRTRGHDGEVEVTIRDNGRGMSADEADTIFDPSFKVSGSRVASANWSLFSSRQIVYEHGGDIRIETAPGAGTTFHVMLPV